MNCECESLRRKCPYLEFFWPVSSRIRTEYPYLTVLGQNAGIYGPGKLQIQAHYRQWMVIFSCEEPSIMMNFSTKRNGNI